MKYTIRLSVSHVLVAAAVAVSIAVAGCQQQDKSVDNTNPAVTNGPGTVAKPAVTSTPPPAALAQLQQGGQAQASAQQAAALQMKQWVKDHPNGK